MDLELPEARLCSERRWPASFNFLGYEKNWAYYETDLLFEGIVHEVGTHLLIGVAKLAWGKDDPRHRL